MKPRLIIDEVELQQLMEILEEGDCLRLPTGESFSRQKGLEFIYDTAVHGSTVCITVDRNVFKWILSLQKPPKTNVQPQAKQAAALMAYATRMGFLLEPAIAVIEEPDGIERWKAQLSDFRALDNLNPKNFTDIATGRATSVDEADFARVRGLKSKPSENFTLKKPTGWRIDYISMLKIALLILAVKPKDPTSADMKQYVEWCFKDFIFSAPAVIYGAFALSRKFGRMIKGIGGEVAPAFCGIANATWDLTLLRYWSRRVLQSPVSGRIELLCSFDRAVQECARHLLISERGNCSPRDARRLLLTKAWGTNAGGSVDDLWESLTPALDSAARTVNAISSATARDAYFEGLQDTLEDELRSRCKKG